MSRALILLVLAVALAALPAPAGAGGASSSEAETSEAEPRMDADALLRSGAGAVAEAGAPAVLTLDLARAAGAPSGILDLALTPERVARDEPFLVSVTAEAPGAPPREVASVSFFPPPREGETRHFLIDVSALPDAGRATLSVHLVPATDAPLAQTQVRVEGLTLPE